MKIALATILALSSPAAMAGDYYYRTVGHTTNQTCYRKVVREEYIPPYRSHYGEGYINPGEEDLVIHGSGQGISNHT